MLKWWQELFRQSPVIALLIAILLTGAYQYWVWGSTYRDMKADRDEYKQIALQSVGLLEKHVVTSPSPLPSPVPSPIRLPSPRPLGSPTPDWTYLGETGVEYGEYRIASQSLKTQVDSLQIRLNTLEAKPPK